MSYWDVLPDEIQKLLKRSEEVLGAWPKIGAAWKAFLSEGFIRLIQEP